MTLGANYQKRQFSFDATYSFIFGAYKEITHDKIQNTTLLMRIPQAFVNHLDLVAQYDLPKDKSVGITLSLDFFKNHGPGTTQPCYDIGPLKNPRVIYDTTTTILLLGFASVSF